MKMRFAFVVLALLLNAAAAFADDLVVFCKDGESFYIDQESDGEQACRDHDGIDYFAYASK